MNIQYELLLDLLNELINEDINKTLFLHNNDDCKSIEFIKSMYHGDGIKIRFSNTSIAIYIINNIHENKIKYSWADITSITGHIDIANPNWIQETIEMIKSHTFPEHMCGLSGYNPMLGDICPACEYIKAKWQCNNK